MSNWKDVKINLENQWKGRGDLALLNKRLQAKGVKPGNPRIEDLASMDQLHAGQLEATYKFASWVAPCAGDKVMDFGSGLGGPARVLARDFGCTVTALEPIEELHIAAGNLTKRLNLDTKVEHICKIVNDLEMYKTYDIVWIQHVDVHLWNREEIYKILVNHLSDRGRIVWHDWLATGKSGVTYPLPWSKSESVSFLADRSGFKKALCGAGLDLKRFEKVTDITRKWFEAGKAGLEKLLKKQSVVASKSLGNVLLEVNNMLNNLDRGSLVPFFAEARPKVIWAKVLEKS
ncbi:MAG: methyltransferase domain-containing protein [Deltaproteobacteria bacterium]|nr:methyltransferase domain-containing protein [Deltaproteobacteria bacterium]